MDQSAKRGLFPSVFLLSVHVWCCAGMPFVVDAFSTGPRCATKNQTTMRIHKRWVLLALRHHTISVLTRNTGIHSVYMYIVFLKQNGSSLNLVVFVVLVVSSVNMYRIVTLICNDGATHVCDVTDLFEHVTLVWKVCVNNPFLNNPPSSTPTGIDFKTISLPMVS